MNNDVPKVVSLLKMHRHRNLGNILSEKLYQNLYFGTKKVIEGLFEEI